MRHGASPHAIGVAVVVGPGSVQLLPEHIHINSRLYPAAHANSSSMVYPFVKLTLEGQKWQVAFSDSAVLPFSTLQQKVTKLWAA